MRTNRPIRRTASAVVAFAALTLAAGCGGGNSSHGGHTGSQTSPTTSASQANTQHNEADIAFAQGMIPHHQQAVEMAEMAETRAASTEVKALAAKIKQAQDPEIDQMTAWLTAWGVPVPSASSGGHDMHGGSHGGMPGMMTDHDMSVLMGATGADFDRMFLEMMIRHHEGAVEMARTEQQQGQNEEAKALAKKIEADQTAEIEQMRAMLNAE